ncbi:MAG: hypothetical protein E6K75_07615, partial [Candidatus Eisenbacteria bacterium]
MSSISVAKETWPPLKLSEWEDTRATLHLWTQVVGKICLALTPLTNHWWNVTFHFTARGLSTPAMTVGGRTLRMTFDFVEHQLVFQTSDGVTKTIPLEPRTVAEFFERVMETLRDLGIQVHIWTMPVEIPDPIRFEKDVTHHSYDRDAVNAFWRALLAMKPVFEKFRCAFIGKCSPLHFFWGGFDLAVTRFNGKRAPERPGANSIDREAYSHEVISHGFWPGRLPALDACFYAYAAPEPHGFKEAKILPAAAYYDKGW